MTTTPRYIDSKISALDFGTAAGLTSLPGAFNYIYGWDISCDLDYEMLERQRQKADPARGPEPMVVGAQKGSVSWREYWRGGKTSAGAGGQSRIAAIGQYCGMALHNLPGGTGTITGGSSSTITALDADFSGYAVGDFILVDLNNGASLQLRPITRVQSAAGTTTLTVSPEWDTETPQSGDDFYPVDVLVPSPAKVATYHGFYVYRGEDGTNEHTATIKGAVGKFKLENVKAGSLPVCAWEFLVDNWSVADGGARADQEDPFAEPVPWLSDSFYLDNEQLDIESFEFDPGCSPIALVGQGGQGRIGWRYMDPNPSVKFVPYHAAQYWADWAAGTQRAAFCQSVLDQYSAWGIWIPGCQFQKVGYGELSEGMVSSDMTVKISDPGENADSTDYPLFSICLSAV